jgi:hypothetical protein
MHCCHPWASVCREEKPAAEAAQAPPGGGVPTGPDDNPLALPSAAELGLLPHVSFFNNADLSQACTAP